MIQAYENQLIERVQQCCDAIAIIRPANGIASKSPATQADYLSLARHLLLRATCSDGGLVQVVQATGRSTTFYKRIAALRYHCFAQMEVLLSEFRNLSDETAWTNLSMRFEELLGPMRALVALKQQGMTRSRRKRRSKRQALPGLPPDWRTRLYQRGERGKYALALLVSALTGARPSELVQGVEVWQTFDETLGHPVICFHVRGSKVNAHQGQPNRYTSYSLYDNHPLVAAMVERLSTQPGHKLLVQIAKECNFAAEVRRLGQCLWPSHKRAITPYCFRHQWSADLKSSGSADAVSRGLGHSSAKTRRHYGTANQASTAYCLHPVRIEADRPVQELRSSLPTPGATPESDL